MHASETRVCKCKPTQYLMKHTLMIIVLFQLAAQLLSISLSASEHNPVKVLDANDVRLTFTVRPVTVSLDTIEVGSDQFVVPTFAGATYRESVINEIVVRQWIASYDVIVPNPNGFSFSATELQYRSVDIAFGQKLPLHDRIATQPPLQQKIQVEYTGIARDRHVATIRIVLAETVGGKTTVLDGMIGEFLFSPGPRGTSPNPTVSAQSSLYVLNPEAPWVVQTVNRKSSIGNETQGGTNFENVFRMKIEKDGIYRITADQLKSAGIPTDAETAKSIHVYSNGGAELTEQVPSTPMQYSQETPITIKSNSDGSISSIMFYASGPSGFAFEGGEFRHYIHHYSTFSGYILTWGGNDGLRAVANQLPSGAVVNQPLAVTGRVFNEDELVNPYTSGSGRRWLGRSIENGGSLTVSTILPGLLSTGSVTFKSVVGHKGSKQGTFTVQENGNTVAQRVVPEVPKYMDTYTVATSGLVNAGSMQSDSRSVLKFNYECADRVSTGIIDWFELHYPRAMIADGGTFEFWTDPSLQGVTQYSVNGFGGEVYCYDVTNAWSPKLEINSGNGETFVLKTELTANSPKRFFISSAIQGTSLEKVTYKNYKGKTEGADMVVISHPSLLKSANAYKDYRSAKDNMKVLVVTTDELFNEFSYGAQDPSAIRNFLSYAVMNWVPAPRYALLWGDGHFDYKNISTQTTNFVIPYESLDPDDKDWGLFTYTSDDYYSRVVGDDLRPDIAIGRLPVSSNTIGNRIVEKIKKYETSSATDDWRTRVTMIADDGAAGAGVSDGDLHLGQSETLCNYFVPSPLQPKKIYLVEYPTENVASGRRKPAVTQDFVSTINTTGSLTVNWIGHGNPRVWAHELIFERETTPPQLTNYEKPFFLTAATCDFSRFDLTETQSGAEELVLLANGGAIGVFSATRVVFAYQNAEINQEFHKTLYTRGADGKFPRLGDVLYNVKQKFFASNDEKFYLLGDPTVRLLIPDHKVVFSSVNDKSTTDSVTVVLESLSTVTVSGFVSRPMESNADNSFNGVITISLLDAQKKVTIVDNDERQTVNKFTVPGAALNRGTFKVINGEFQATFVIPKDIAFSAETAKLYGYAYSTDERTAMGMTNKVSVDGVADVRYDDEDGPELNIYMDSRHFNSGEVVRENPILIVDMVDETGINSTGVGIGHELEASFDGGKQIVNLTQNVTTSLENSRSASAQKQIFDLGPGLHSVRVRAWDVLNNFSQKTIEFRIAKSSEGIVSRWVSNYPNPFSSSTTIRYQHNIPKSFTAELRIFDMHGSQVFGTGMATRDMQTAEITWDGRDYLGGLLSSGVYSCVVRVTDEFGSISDITGKVSLIR